MNFFEKKTYNMEKKDANIQDNSKKRDVKPLFEFEGKYEDEDQYVYTDENINMAIELRENK